MPYINVINSFIFICVVHLCRTNEINVCPWAWTMEMVIMITLHCKWKHVKWERKTESVLPKPKANKSIKILFFIWKNSLFHLHSREIFAHKYQNIKPFAKSKPKSFRHRCALQCCVWKTLLSVAFPTTLSIICWCRNLGDWGCGQGTTKQFTLQTMLVRKWFERDFQTI